MGDSFGKGERYKLLVILGAEIVVPSVYGITVSSTLLSKLRLKYIDGFAVCISFLKYSIISRVIDLEFCVEKTSIYPFKP
jgi:hypothetical protein